MAVWAKSTGFAFDHDLTVTGFSSGDEKTIARPTTTSTTTRNAIRNSLTMS